MARAAVSNLFRQEARNTQLGSEVDRPYDPSAAARGAPIHQSDIKSAPI